MDFTTAAIPNTTRARINPFDEAIAANAKTITDGKASEAVSVTVSTDDVDKHRRSLYDSAKYNGVSVRVVIGEDKKGKTVLTFWATDRVTRTRKTD